MAHYTQTLQQIIENGVDIFNFTYPIEPAYKNEFENKFIKHFYFYEIGLETVGRFLWHLESELNLIMPYYMKIYKSQNLEQRILDNYDVTETFTRSTEDTQTATTNANNKNLYSDTPKKKINIDNFDYVTNITQDTNDINNNVNNAGNENWTRKMVGNIGIQTDADAIMKYEKSLRNLEKEIFKELESLFMGVY